jgi:hypothetical protein
MKLRYLGLAVVVAAVASLAANAKNEKTAGAIQRGHAINDARDATLPTGASSGHASPTPWSGSRTSDPRKVIEKRKDDGTRLFHLNGQGRESMMVRRASDGSLEWICTDALEEVLSKGASNDR